MVSYFPEKTPSTPKNLFTFALFCPDCLKICIDGERKGEAGEQPGSIQKGTPPPFGERKECLAPIIFRTKNTAKSRLGLIGKNFGKNLRENVSGERKPPILWKGGEVLKYERLDAKIVELFVNARGEFFHFVFVP